MIQQEKIDDLWEMSEQMRSLRPDLYHGYYNLGRAAMQKKEYDAAVTSFKKALECDPEQYVVHERLSAAFFELQDFDQSLIHKQKSLRLKEATLAQTETGPAGLRTLAASQAADGNFSEAVETSRQALQAAMSLGLRQTARDILKEIELYKKNISEGE